MKIIKTKIKGLLIIKTKIYKDVRGFFKEVEKNQLLKKKFIFDCLSFSKKNTLRGLHLQKKKSQAKIITAEAKGGWLQRNWRPLLMLTFAGLVVAHWFGYTAPNIPESVQNSLLNIVLVGMGGYIVGRSGEKIMDKYKDKK